MYTYVQIYSCISVHMERERESGGDDKKTVEREGAACTWLWYYLCIIYIYIHIYIYIIYIYIYNYIYNICIIIYMCVFIYIYMYTCLHMQLRGVLPTRRVFVGSSWNSVFQSQAKSLEDESTGKSPNKEAGQLDPCGLTRPSWPTGVIWRCQKKITKMEICLKTPFSAPGE